MNLLESSTLSNQDISSALLVHTYTADAERKIFFRLFADAIAGDGDYVAYVTVQRAGAGSAYRVAPITTATVESGVTASLLTSIAFPVSSGDVVKVYLTGLAGDTTTPDIITEVWNESLSALGTGPYSATPTVTDGSGSPIADVEVYVRATSSTSGTVIRRGTTNSAGQVTFWFEEAGTYYTWKVKDKCVFTNPESLVVS